MFIYFLFKVSFFFLVAPSTNVCYNVTHQQCKNDLHYNYTFIPIIHQAELATVFQPVISSKCSTELEKFLCYTQYPPCDPNRPSKTFTPCESLCDTIDKKCWREFKKANILLPHCDFIYPKMIGTNGLCEVTEWPVSWPKEFRPVPYRKYSIACAKCIHPLCSLSISMHDHVSESSCENDCMTVRPLTSWLSQNLGRDWTVHLEEGLCLPLPSSSLPLVINKFKSTTGRRIWCSYYYYSPFSLSLHSEAIFRS